MRNTLGDLNNHLFVRLLQENAELREKLAVSEKQ